MTEGVYAHIAAVVWLAKGKAALTLLACYFTRKASLHRSRMYLDSANLQQRHTIC